MRDEAREIAFRAWGPVQLAEQMLGERGCRIFHAVEVERLLAAAGGDHVGEAVRFERLRLPVHVERPVVVGAAADQIVRAGIVRSLVPALVVGREFARRCLALLVVRPRLEQRVLRQLLGDIGFKLEVAELQELDRLGELGRQHQLLRLANA